MKHPIILKSLLLTTMLMMSAGIAMAQCTGGTYNLGTIFANGQFKTESFQPSTPDLGQVTFTVAAGNNQKCDVYITVFASYGDDGSEEIAHTIVSSVSATETKKACFTPVTLNPGQTYYIEAIFRIQGQ